MPEGRLMEVLSSMSDELVERVDADACAISRVIGDVLILVVERAPEGMTLQSGQGYLVSDYPQTAEVLATGTPRLLRIDDADVDEAEAAVLRDYGFAALAMVPLELNGERWGLVELYRKAARAFSSADVELMRKITRME